MVARRAGRTVIAALSPAVRSRASQDLVPRFASLRDFILARKWYHRGAFQILLGPEREDLEKRMRRYVRSRYVLSPWGVPVLQEAYSQPHIKYTQDTH